MARVQYGPPQIGAASGDGKAKLGRLSLSLLTPTLSQPCVRCIMQLSSSFGNICLETFLDVHPVCNPGVQLWELSCEVVVVVSVLSLRQA